MRALLPRLKPLFRCQGTEAPLGIYKSTWGSGAQPIMTLLFRVVLTLNRVKRHPFSSMRWNRFSGLRVAHIKPFVSGFTKL